MIALSILLAIVLLIVIAAWVAHLTFRRTQSRWVQAGAFVLVLWLPFWNVIPGWLAYRKAVQELGGQRIYQTVQAEGFLDSQRIDSSMPWLALKSWPFRYVEIERTYPRGPLMALEQRPGYYEYRLHARGAPECEATATIANIDRVFDKFGLKDLCVSSRWRPSARSRYEWDGGGWEPLPHQPWPGNVYVAWQRLADRQTGKVIAESYMLEFRPWYWPFFSPQHTRDETGKSLTFDPATIILVPETATEEDPNV